MSMLFDRDTLIDLLAEVGELLDAQNIRGDLFVVGGAAMALAFDSRKLTSDVDSVFEPKSTIADAARVVADRHPGLDPDWINDAMKGFLPHRSDEPQVILDVPGLRVTVPTPECLLAMKVQASRVDRDEDDIKFLAEMLNLSTAEQVLDLVEDFYPRRFIEAKTQFFIQEIFP